MRSTEMHEDDWKRFIACLKPREYAKLSKISFLAAQILLRKIFRKKGSLGVPKIARQIADHSILGRNLLWLCYHDKPFDRKNERILSEIGYQMQEMGMMFIERLSP